MRVRKRERERVILVGERMCAVSCPAVVRLAAGLLSDKKGGLGGCGGGGVPLCVWGWDGVVCGVEGGSTDGMGVGWVK